MHYFITGHTGFKGTWLTHLLCNQGHKVSGYSDRAAEESLFLKHFGCKTRLFFKTFWLLFNHYGFEARLLFKQFRCEARLLFKHVGCEARVGSKTLDAKEEFCSNMSGAKQHFNSKIKTNYILHIRFALIDTIYFFSAEFPPKSMPAGNS